MRNAISGAAAAIIGLTGLTAIANAADYPVYPRERAARVYHAETPYCGARCGCPVVSYVRHRRMLMAYPASFDPRERDQPHYYYGGMRNYPRYERASGLAASCVY